MEQEIHDDLVDQYEQEILNAGTDLKKNESINKKYNPKFSKTVGYMDLLDYGTVCIGYDKKGKDIVDSDILDKQTMYDVNIGSGSITVADQGIAELLSMVAQINERLKRIERRLM